MNRSELDFPQADLAVSNGRTLVNETLDPRPERNARTAQPMAPEFARESEYRA